MINPLLSKLLWLKNRSKCNQVFMAIMINIPMVCFGMVLGWISPMQAVLQSPDGPLNEPLTDVVLSWMASVTFITSIPMEFLIGYLADKMGRKFCILVTSFSLVMCWMIKLVCVTPWLLIVARGIAGIACAGCFVIIPLYVKEISDSSIRGALGSLIILSQNLGYLIMYVAGDILKYDTVNWISFVIPIVHFLAFFAMPETPSFLIKKGKNEDAINVLAWLRCSTATDEVVLEEMHLLEVEEREALQCSNTIKIWKSIIKDKTTFKAFRVTLTVMLAQEICGYLVVLMYASMIFEKAAEAGTALQLSPNKQTIVLGVVQLLGSMVASSVVEKTGRKPLLATTSCVTGIAMLILGVWFYLSAIGIWLPGWLPVSAMCLCIFSDAAGFQPTPYVIMSEMFAFQHRGQVTTIAIASCAMVDFIQIKLFEPLSELVGIYSVFWLFSLLCFAGTLYTVFCVPETKGKSVAEIHVLLGKKDVKDAEDMQMSNL